MTFGCVLKEFVGIDVTIWVPSRYQGTGIGIPIIKTRRPRNLYNGNPMKDSLYIETGTWPIYLFKHVFLNIRLATVMSDSFYKNGYHIYS